MSTRLTGTGVALVTPFDLSLKIDFAALERLVEHVIQGGVEYLVVMGTTGESATLTKEEKKQVLSKVLEVNNGRIPVVYGAGGNNTEALLHNLDDANLSGIDAILSVTPYYNKPSQEGIKRHYEAVANRSPLPIILYNVPGRTGCNVSASTTLMLAQHSNIIGMKEASGDLVTSLEIAANKPKDFMLISGDDMLSLPIISIGGTGTISVIANAFPGPFSKMVNLALKNKFDEASNINYTLLELGKAIMEEGNPVGVKYLLSVLELINAETRLPLVMPSRQLQDKLSKLTADFLVNA